MKNNDISIPNNNPSLSKFIRGKSLMDNEVACYTSHYKLWEKCIKMKNPLVILEDDINFTKDFIPSLIEIYKSNFHYVRLMYLFDREIKNLSKNFYITFDKVRGTQGYFIHPTAAQKFIFHSKNYIFPVDDFMDMFFIHGVWNIVYKPFCIFEDEILSVESTIKQPREKISRISIKIRREFFRFYFDLRKFIFLLINYLKIKKLKNQ